MSKCRMHFVIPMVGLLLAVPCRAGYDFEPPSLRSFVRFWGIGPGPGYHSVPCPHHARRHYRCVTRRLAPPPVESDYYPETSWPHGPGHAPATPGPAMPLAPVLPAVPGTNQPVEPLPLRDREVLESEDPTVPNPHPIVEPQPLTIETAPSPRVRRYPNRPSLLDDLIRERERKLVGAGDPRPDDIPPPGPPAPPASGPPSPASQSPNRPAAEGDNWW